MEPVKIKIDLNTKPSKELRKDLLLSLFDHLLYLRAQIPFRFESFKHFIERKAAETEKKVDFKISRQLKLALDTYEKICAVKEILEIELLELPVMILFGSTIHTAKECYQISFPTVAESTSINHINVSEAVNKIMLSTISTDGLVPCDKNILPTTNVFILLRRSEPIDDGHPELKELKNFKLAKSCKKIEIHFRDNSKFSIFEDFQDLSLAEKAEKRDEALTESHGAETEIWFQLKTFVKGFKDILVNDKSIWE